MASFKSFEKISVWIESKSLTVDIYHVFSSNKDWGFKEQIQRASVSIMNNIAEGSKRQSDKEFIRFLKYANSSNSEVKSMLILAEELNYISHEKRNQLFIKTEKIAGGLTNLIKYLSKE